MAKAAKRICSIPDCRDEAKVRGWCGKHYHRWQRHGDPLKGNAFRVKGGGICIIDGCDRPRVGHGWCEKHWERWRSNGDPLVVQVAIGGDPVKRFWSKVNKEGPIPPRHPELGPCWVWTAGVQSGGYGHFWQDGKDILCHRYAYELLVGPIPAGKPIDHFACDNPPCCNPAHLRPVTNRENILRGTSPQAHNAAKTHCKRGHPFDNANTYVDKMGARVCRTCAREKQREYVRQRKAQAQLPAQLPGQESLFA